METNQSSQATIEAPSPADSGAPYHDPTDPMAGPPLSDEMLRRHGERMFGGIVALKAMLNGINERAQNYGVKAKLEPKRAREFYVRAAELAELCSAIEAGINATASQVSRLVKARPELFGEKANEPVAIG